MKKTWLVGVIIGIHCLVIGSLMLIQGCGTTSSTPATVSVPSEPVMPPAIVEQPVVKTNIITPIKPLEQPIEAKEKSYTVKPGDSLGKIAKRYNVSVRDIVEINKITNPSKIRVGQTLNLPQYVEMGAMTEAPAAAPATHKAVPKKKTVKAKTSHAVAAKGEYMVKSGDSLSKIAARHGTTVKALKEANNLSSDNIRIGQKLAMAGSGKAKTSDTAAPAGEAEVAPIPQGAEPVQGLTPTPVGMEAAPSAATSSIIHMVEPGQDLNSIAMMYSVRLEELMKLNGLTNANVKTGQSLKIPPPAE